MNTLLRRALARHLGILALGPVGAALAATVAAEGAPTDAPLTFAAATELALASQPLLEAQQHAVRGALAAATADAQLPDPMLVGGATDVPATGPDAYSFTDDPDTQLMLGIRQMFPGGGEREWRGTRGQAEADRMAGELEDQRRMVRREAALAWLDAWKAIRAQELVTASITEAQRQLDAVDIAYRAGRAMQADLLASRVTLELLHDQRDGLLQDEWHARNELRRWIGADAERPLAAQPPDWTAPDEGALLAGLGRHPHVAAQVAAVNVARADIEIARADYAPDWSVELAYGYRADFDDMASLQFEIGLPLFTRKRQDRVVESRAAELQRAESLREDWLRQHRAHVQLNVADWRRLQDRFRRFDEIILPAATQRLDAALAAYGAGRGMLLAVIEARRGLLDVRMQRLDLELDAARHQVQLAYFASHGDQP